MGQIPDSFSNASSLTVLEELVILSNLPSSWNNTPIDWKFLLLPRNFFRRQVANPWGNS